MEKENKNIVKGNIKLSKPSANNKAIKVSSKKISSDNVKVVEKNKTRELIAATAEAVVNMEPDVNMVEKQTEEIIRKVLMLEGVG